MGNMEVVKNTYFNYYSQTRKETFKLILITVLCKNNKYCILGITEQALGGQNPWSTQRYTLAKENILKKKIGEYDDE
jgi:hypothetical protein